MKLNEKWAFCICDFETTGISEDSLPIEVGCIWTDSKFRTIKTYDAMVRWDELTVASRDNWQGDEMHAFKVHGITYGEYSARAEDVGVVADKIIGITRGLLGKQFERVILISDNAKFENHHMKLITDKGSAPTWPFHYCTWDTSLFLEAVGVGDPPEPKHRALPDAADLQVAIIQGMDRVRHIGD